VNTPLDLDAYVAIVEAGSISEAARVLGEPRATLSRRLGRLEEHLGVRLVHRSSRHLELTRAGQELYQRGRHIVDQVQAAENALRRLDDVPRGPLRISVPPDRGAAMLGRLLSEFLDRYPEVRPDVLATDRHVDLVREGFDVAIRAGRDSDPSLIRRVLAHHRLWLVASPAYLARHGTPERVEDLDRHVCVVNYAGTDRARPVWPRLEGGEVRVPAGIATNDLSIGLAMALGGHGLVMLPDVAVAPFAARGELVAVLADVLGARGTMALVYPEKRLLEPQVRAFIDFALAWFDDHREEILTPRWTAPCPTTAS
jgi:DNA-binding transcriptional LysR family regulator